MNAFHDVMLDDHCMLKAIYSLAEKCEGVSFVHCFLNYCSLCSSTAFFGYWKGCTINF